MRDYLGSTRGRNKHCPHMSYPRQCTFRVVSSAHLAEPLVKLFTDATTTILYRRVSKDTGRETPEWRRKIIENITSGQAGPVKDLFSPIGLENIFRPPPAQPPSPTRLQHFQLPPSGTPSRHQFAAKGSMIPLPASMIASTPPRAPSPPRKTMPKLSPPRPQTKTSEVSTPRRALSEVPDMSNTPNTSPMHGDVRHTTSQFAGDSIEGSSGFKPAATSTLRGMKPSAPLKSVEQNHIRLGKRKAYTIGDGRDESGPDRKSELIENRTPTAPNSPEGGENESNSDWGQESDNGFHYVEEKQCNEMIVQRPGKDAPGDGPASLTFSGNAPASRKSSHVTSEYPSSPPWLTSSQQFESVLSIPVASSPLLEGQEAQDIEQGDEEEGVLPPNELNVELALSREKQKAVAPRPLPDTPTLPMFRPRAAPQPLPSPDDPFASHTLAHPRIFNPPRTPSPKKQDPPGPGPSNGSPLKLFAGTYDTFTKERLVRRISELEGTTTSSTDESKEISEPNSDQLYGSNPEISVIEPPGTPLTQARPFPVVEDSQMSLRRPRQRTGSSSSLPNDGIHGPRSPLKERTPKRMRRSWSGNKPSSLLTQEQKIGAEDNDQRSSEETSTKLQHPCRSSTSSPTPRPRNSTSSIDSPVAESTCPGNGSDPLEKQDTTQSPSIGAGSIVFGGSGEGSLMGTEFQGLGIGRDMNNKHRKGSVTTQDFLAQAEEVMLRIRAMTALNGEQSWFSEGTTGLESFLSGGELSLSAEEFSLVREKLMNLSIASAQKHRIPIQRPSKKQTRSATSTVVNAPELQGQPTRQQEGNAGAQNRSGTTRRYPATSTTQQDVIDALCAAVISDRHTVNLKNVTMRPKSKVASTDASENDSLRRSRAASAESYTDIRSVHPTQVEHLIPISIGSMTFDPVQKAWVKGKAQKSHSEFLSPSKEKKEGTVIPKGSMNERRPQPGDDTDEDVFHGIPDLSVDEEMEARALIEASRMQEMISELEEYVIADSDQEAEYEYTSTKVIRRIEREEIRREIRGKRVVNEKEEEGDVTQESQEWDQTRHEGDESSEDVSGDLQEESSWMDENSEENDTVLRQERPESSNGSISTQSAFTEPRTETRSTSWGDSVGERKGERPKMEEALNQLSLMDSTQTGAAYEKRPHELDERIVDEEEEGYSQQQRSAGDRAVDYSSPSVSTISRQSRNARAGKRVDWVADESEMSMDQNLFANSSASQGSSKSFRVLSSRNTSYNKRLSSGGRSFLGRPVSRINEEDEEDTEQMEGSSHEQGLSSALTPASVKGKGPRDIKPVPPPATIQRPNVSFHFSSPLPELSYQFETTRELLNLELSYVAQRHGGVGGKGKQPSMKSIEYSFSVAQDNLVRHLTDVEPFEPYWEYMKSLKLNDRKILTIHGLHEWCPRIEELDVSANEIGQVSGVPNTVRNLKISSNRLSGLTAWGHLTNLQYLDISRNNLDSLAGEIVTVITYS